MIDNTDHIQHTWNLTHPTGDRITIDLWTDDETVRVEGGDHEHMDRGPKDVDRLLAKYQAAGYRVDSTYKVNDPHNFDDEPDDEPADKPEECPECGHPVEYAPNHVADHRQGDAWLCTGCRWGQWI
jgi:hypothetical protein